MGLAVVSAMLLAHIWGGLFDQMIGWQAWACALVRLPRADRVSSGAGVGAGVSVCGRIRGAGRWRESP